MCKNLFYIACLLLLSAAPAFGAVKSYLIVVDENIYRTFNPVGDKTGMPLPAVEQLKSLYGADVDLKGIDVNAGTDPFTRLFIKKYDLVIAVGYNASERAYSSGLNNRYQKFALLGSYRTRLPENMTAVHFNTGEAAFVAGYIAARVSQNNHIGFMAPEKTLAAMDILRAFKDGARLGESNTSVLAKFDDRPFEMRDQAAKMYSSAIDVVFQAGEFYGPEVLTSAQYARKWYMGINIDQYDVDTTHILASVKIDYNRAILEMAALLENDALPGGQVVTMQLANDGVSLALLDNVPPDVMESALKVIDNIITKVVKVRNDSNKIINR